MDGLDCRVSNLQSTQKLIFGYFLEHAFLFLANYALWSAIIFQIKALTTFQIKAHSIAVVKTLFGHVTTEWYRVDLACKYQNHLWCRYRLTHSIIECFENLQKRNLFNWHQSTLFCRDIMVEHLGHINSWARSRISENQWQGLNSECLQGNLVATVSSKSIQPKIMKFYFQANDRYDKERHMMLNSNKRSQTAEQPSQNRLGNSKAAYKICDFHPLAEGIGHELLKKRLYRGEAPRVNHWKQPW